MAFQVATPKSLASRPTTSARSATWSVVTAIVVMPVAAAVRDLDEVTCSPPLTATEPDLLPSGFGEAVTPGVSTLPKPGTEGMVEPGRGWGEPVVAADAAF